MFRNSPLTLKRRRSLAQTPLEFIIGVKAGIGRSFAEAQAAMTKAKKTTGRIKENDSFEVARTKVLSRINAKDYDICVYLPEIDLFPDVSLVKGIEVLESNVTKSIADMERVEAQYGKNSIAYDALQTQIGMQSLDPATGALTPFGYLFQQKFRVNDPTSGAVERFVIYVDANDMHYWNRAVGEEVVDVHLAAIGRALVKGTRQTTSASGTGWESIRKFDAGIPDQVCYVSRTHGSAGDEFLVDLYCREEDVIKVVNRLFDTIYREQKKLSER